MKKKTDIPGQITVWDIDKVKPYELNAKIHDPKQVERIAKSISEFGWDQPIVVDATGTIIKGHGRRLAALKLGLTRIPVWVRDDLTPEQVRASRLADNRVAVGDIDSSILQKELEGLEYDLKGIFDEKELTFLEEDLGEFNADAFVDDIEIEVGRQTEETQKTVESAKLKDVPIDKALGFKMIKGSQERHVAAFMAQIEEETGLEGADAFVDFIQKLLDEDQS